MQVVDLDRRFKEVPNAIGHEDLALQDQRPSFLGADVLRGWSDLLEHKVVVILGEPGSGKTKEFELRAAKLRSASEYAFLLPLEDLTQRPLMEVLHGKDRSEFRSWKKKNKVGYFFFDSIDESRLRSPKDFPRALDSINDGLTHNDLLHARLFFSSRIYEWNPESDLTEVERRFCSPYREKDADLQAGEWNVPAPLIVLLAPLDQDRIATYARHWGLPRIEAFLAALDQKNAWDFARRPLDVQALFQLWKQEGRLGTLTETIEAITTASLRETPKRQDPLSEERAREGAETLAAAAILCKRQRFKVPDDAYVSSDALLAPEDCLPRDWLSSERRTLMNRAIFESACFGAIRFHNRRTTEYLVACWLKARMRGGYPLERLEDLLVERINGILVLRPALASVSAWLAGPDGGGDDAHTRLVRDLVAQSAPEVHLKFGDPEVLPITYKRKLLESICARCRDKRQWWAELDLEALKRLADPALTSDITLMVQDRSLATQFRAALLFMIRARQLDGCMEAALAIYEDETEESEVKISALAALRDVADPAMKGRLLAHVNALTNIPSYQAGVIIEALYPEFLSAPGVEEILRKTQMSKEIGVGLPWLLCNHLRKGLAAHHAKELLERILGLMGEEPYLPPGGSEVRVSQKYAWLAQVLPLVLLPLLEKEAFEPTELPLVLKGIEILDDDVVDPGFNDGEVIRDVKRALQNHLDVVRHGFWDRVIHFRHHYAREPLFYRQLSGGRGLLSLDSSDIAWLAKDVVERDDSVDRSLALRVALDLWIPALGSLGVWLSLKKATSSSNDPALAFWSLTWQRLMNRPYGAWVRHVKFKLLNSHWWTGKGYLLKRSMNMCRNVFLAHRNLLGVYQGRSIGWLYYLCQAASGPNGNHQWTARDWLSLRKKYGRLAMLATRHGCEVAWSAFAPQLPHQKSEPHLTSAGTIIGLTGLQSLWERKVPGFKSLSLDEARTAARYAMDELNGFPDWLPELARLHPQAVEGVLIECIEGEWNYEEGREHPHEVISKIAWQGQEYWPLVTGHLIGKLGKGDPARPEILRFILTIILGSMAPPYGDLRTLASTRVQEDGISDSSRYVWVAFWMQIDAGGAIDWIEDFIHDKPKEEREKLMRGVCAHLIGTDIGPSPILKHADYLGPASLRKLIPLLYSVDPASGGALENVRASVVQRLAQFDDPMAVETLRESSERAGMEQQREWILHLIDQWLERRSDLPPWRPRDVQIFAAEFESDPKTDRDLFRIACARLMDIRYEVEASDNSIRDEVHRDWDEPTLRKWLARKLEERSRKRYDVPQEAEVDRAKKPDLRFFNPHLRATIPVEIKWAENWTAAELLERLENQLVGEYMQAHNIRYGIFLLAYIGRQAKWRSPDRKRLISLHELVAIVEERARSIQASRADVEGIRVLAIDFT